MQWIWRTNAKRIYLDHAAATPVRPEALRAWNDAVQTFGNPGGIHTEGTTALELLEKAREAVARVFQSRAGEIVFTSGGTEGNNIAIFGVFGRDSLEGVHIVVSSIEHPSVLEPIAELERRGARVTRIAPDVIGRIAPDVVQSALTPQTRLVSIGWANGEIGVIQPLSTIAKAIRAYEKEHGTRVIFHTDGGQAPLYARNTANSLGIDVMTLDSGKFYGPRGIGALFVKHGVTLVPIMYGGGQEGGLRAGTENPALAIGFAAALRAAAEERESESKRLTELKKEFIAAVTAAIPDVILNGDTEDALPHIVNISIPRMDAEYTALALDHRGVAVSTKTSCREGERESGVIRALGGGEDRASSSLRFSFGLSTTSSDVIHAIQVLKEILDARPRH